MKKRIFLAIGFVFVVAITIISNTSHPASNGVVSLLSIRTMATASTECTSHLLRWNCCSTTNPNVYVCVPCSSDGTFFCDGN